VHLPQNVTAAEKLMEKCRAFDQSDRFTPILGDVVRRATELNGGLPEHTSNALLPVKRWTTSDAPDAQYPNELADWMIALANSQMPGFDWRRFQKHLEKAKTLAELMKFPLCQEPERSKPKKIVVVDDDVITPPCGKDDATPSIPAGPSALPSSSLSATVVAADTAATVATPTLKPAQANPRAGPAQKAPARKSDSNWRVGDKKPARSRNKGRPK
jgi:hypothetical protein